MILSLTNQVFFSLKTWKTILKVFKIDDQEEEFIPKNAKISKNIGRDTPTAVGPKSFGKSPKLGFTAGPNWGFNSKQHHLHRPIEKYFSDKEEEQLKKEEAEKLEKIKEKSLEENQLNELQKIRELIKAEKHKIKLCLLCKRKFANAIHYSNHEKFSIMHKNNSSKKKNKNRLI